MIEGRTKPRLALDFKLYLIISFIEEQVSVSQCIEPGHSKELGIWNFFDM